MTAHRGVRVILEITDQPSTRSARSLTRRGSPKDQTACAVPPTTVPETKGATIGGVALSHSVRLNDHMRLQIFPLALILLAGCDAPIEHFEPNDVYALTLATSQGTDAASVTDAVTPIVEKLFGTPNEPRWPSELLSESATTLVDTAEVRRSAGRVYSDRDGVDFGLYSKHCVVCHGVEGSGAGAAAVFQNPYPRDFRAGVFKWKSTERAAKPTREDLNQLLHAGLPGSGMPSFAVIDEEDRSALVDYLIYLSVRGEVERKLQLMFAVDEWDDTVGTDDPMIADTVNDVAATWVKAPSQIVDVPDETTNDEASINRGKDTFHGLIANCVGCHGPAGNGMAVTLDYDDWAKEYSTRLGLTPTDRDAMKPFRKAGALRPRLIQPRNLQDGVFRGSGGTSNGKAIYRQISQGIAGTPMPAVEITPEESKKGLTASQVWDLVHYVQSLH